MQRFISASVLPVVFHFLRLSKPIITLSVSLSALTGYLLHDGYFSSDWIYLYLGVMLIAGGSSAINQIQEVEMDQKMHRTRFRPIPSGKISFSLAWIWAGFLSLAGAFTLWQFTNTTAALLAILTLVWYNIVYTPLKRKTPWAILPGALVGAFPPIIGWTAAGGYISDTPAVFIAFFFFIGQIPHFWLILLKYGNDYERAGFPSITQIFSPRQISRLTFVWASSTAVTAMFLPLFHIITNQVISVIVVILSFLLIIAFHKWPGIKSPVRVGRAFMIMNMYFLLIMLSIIADALLR